MIRWTLCAALVLTMATSAVLAQEAAEDATPEQKFKAMDKDGDGALTIQEYVGDKVGEEATEARADFNKKDINQDGKLTLEECKAAEKEEPAK